MLAARHDGMGRSAELLLHLQRGRAEALRRSLRRDADAARSLQPAPGSTPGVRADEARPARARGRPAQALSLHGRQRPRVRAHLRDRAGDGAHRARRAHYARLPYMGICSEPQRKIAALLGETADDDLRRRIAGHLGGESGCAQLYDLTADLLKLLT